MQDVGEGNKEYASLGKLRRSWLTFATQCDRESPECLKCREAGATCIQRRMGLVLDPAQPDASSYIEGLQKRVQRLELAAAKGPSSSPSGAEPSPADVVQVSTSGESAADERTDATQTHGEDLVTTMHVMDYLPLSAMAEPRDRQQTSQHQQYSFETFLNAAISVSGADPAYSITKDSALSESIESFYLALAPAGIKLSRSIADEPVQRYLDMCDAACPFLDRKAFHAGYTHIMESLEKAQVGVMSTHAASDLLMVDITIASGILVSPDYRHKESVSTTLAKRAFRLVPRVLSESDDSAIVRCLIALIIYSTLSPYGGSTWHLMGLALARTMSAGMHTSGVSDCRAPEKEKQESGRLFWSLYVLDA